MPDNEDRHWAVLISITLALTLFIGIFHVFGVFFEPLRAQFGWTSAATASVFSVNMLVYLSTQFLTGRLCDVFSPGPIIAIGVGLYALGVGAMALAQNLWHVYFFYGILAGVGLGGVWTPCIALINKLYVRRRGWATGIAVAGSGSGIALLAPLAGWLLDSLGWRTAYGVLGLVLGAAALVVSVVLLRALRRPVAAEAMRRTGGPSGGVGGATGNSVIGQAFRSWPLWLLLLGALCFGMGSSVLMVYLVPLALHTGIPELVAAALLTVVGVARVPSSLGMGWLSDRADRRTLLTVCSLLLALTMLAVYGVRSLPLLFTAAVIFGLGFAAAMVLLPGITAELFGPAHAGSMFAVVNGGLGLGVTTGPVLAGYLIDLSGNYGWALLTGAGQLVTAGTALLLLRLLSPGLAMGTRAGGRVRGPSPSGSLGR